MLDKDVMPSFITTVGHPRCHGCLIALSCAAMQALISQVFVGGVGALADSGRPSAIVKHAVSHAVGVTEMGLDGDAQADTSVHGGPEKAVHLYPADHYQQLAKRFPDLREVLLPGVLGENLSVRGLTESDVHVGDIWRVGTARLQLCQPRMPCWKIDARLGHDGVAAHIDAHGLTGWYGRVVENGAVGPGDAMIHESTPRGAMTLAQALALCGEHRPDLDALQALIATPGLARRWAVKLHKRLHYLQRL